MKVVMIPDNHDYILELKNSLISKGVNVKLIPYFHYATPLNIIKLLTLKLRGYNIFHIHFEYSFPFMILMKAVIKLLKKLNYRIVWTIHDISHDYKYSNTKFQSKEKSHWLYQNVDYKFVHYKSNLEKLKNCFDVELNNVEVIFHPVFNYPNKISREDARRKLGIPLSAKVLLSFGEVKEYKGQIELIKAFEKLKNEYFCLIAGSGKNDPKTTEFIKNKAVQYSERFLFINKYIPNDEIQIYFNASDVVVLPYKWITQSGIIPLAYSFSKPVIVTDVGATSEMVINGETGFVVPIDNNDALVQAINKIFTMDHEKMGKKANELAIQKLTWDVLAEKTIKIYKKVVS
jgi:glycosyltransferase involved in cell wall biosynthesis